MFPGFQPPQLNTPDAVKRQRAIAEALIGRSSTPGSNWAEGLGDIAAAISGTVLNGRADEAQTAGTDSIAAALAGLGPASSIQDISGVLANPWVTESPGASLIASSLLQSNLDANDPMRQLDMQMKQAQLDQMLNPQPQPVDPTAAMQNYQFLLGQGASPEEAQAMAFGSNAPVVNVNTGDSNDFYKALDADAGKQVPAAIDAARNAQTNQIKLQQLETLVGTQGTAPQGAQGAITQFASQLGIPVEGADDIQAAQAIINQMVPLQRPPGSGTMSDADLALFKASLPSIINQPGGNQKIIDTTKAINQYVIQQGEIATMLANRQITREQAAEMQAAIPNPLQGIGQMGAQARPSTPSGITIRRID